VSPQKYWNQIYRYAALAAIGLALTGVVFAFLPKVHQSRAYQATRQALEAEIRSQEEAIKELRIRQERFGSDKYFVQQLAHEIGYAHENEMIYQFGEKPSAGATNDPLKSRP